MMMAKFRSLIVTLTSEREASLSAAWHRGTSPRRKTSFGKESIFSGRGSASTPNGPHAYGAP
jgi:hypothetical protein